MDLTCAEEPLQLLVTFDADESAQICWAFDLVNEDAGRSGRATFVTPQDWVKSLVAEAVRDELDNLPRTLPPLGGPEGERGI